MATTFPALVAVRLAALVERRGFAISEADEHRVVLESRQLRCTCVFDPRGELDVYLTPLRNADWEGWTFSGLVGRASLDRLLELSVAAMHEDPRILDPDASFYSDLAEQRRAANRQFTAHAEGKSTLPRRGHLA